VKMGIVTVFITRKCSHKCPHCMVWRFRRSERPPEFWAEQMKYTWSTEGEGVHFVMLGGEPLEYGGLVDLVRMLGRRNYSFTSNSVSLTRELAERLVSYGLPNWSVSIDLPEELGDDRDRAGFRAIRLMRELGVPDIHVTITVYPWSVKYLRKLFRELKALGVYIEVTVATWAKASWYDFAPPTPVKFTEEHKREIQGAVLEELGSYPRWHGVPEMFTEDLDVILRNEYRCKKPQVVVDEDGYMRLCREVPGKRVRKYTLVSALERWGDFTRDWYADREEMCLGCNWACAYMEDRHYNFTHLKEFGGW